MPDRHPSPPRPHSQSGRWSLLAAGLALRTRLRNSLDRRRHSTTRPPNQATPRRRATPNLTTNRRR